MKMFGSAASASGTPPCRRSASNGRARRRRSRQPDVVPVAHQQQLRDVAHRERQPDDAVAPIVGAVRQRAITAAGIVSQYDDVCICCSGRSSSPEPDVLVRVELDLLEADDARDDVDFAVRSRALRCGLRGRGGCETRRVRDRDRASTLACFASPRDPASRIPTYPTRTCPGSSPSCR